MKILAQIFDKEYTQLRAYTTKVDDNTDNHNKWNKYYHEEEMSNSVHPSVCRDNWQPDHTTLHQAESTPPWQTQQVTRTSRTDRHGAACWKCCSWSCLEAASDSCQTSDLITSVQKKKLTLANSNSFSRYTIRYGQLNVTLHLHVSQVVKKTAKSRAHIHYKSN